MEAREYEQLVKALRCCAGENLPGTKCPYYGESWCDSDCLDKRLKDAANSIEELEAKVPHWVSVEDEKPKEEKLYMTVHRKSKTVRLNWWSNSWGFCYEDSTVEYWMPLPEPPQEETE